MRLKRYLQEEYIGLDRQKLSSVYENPSALDFEMVLKDVPRRIKFKDPSSRTKFVRFMADNKNKKVWIASDETIHAWMWTCVQKRAKSVIYDHTMLGGLAKKTGNKWIMYNSDSLERMYDTEKLEKLFSHDWVWVNKYIVVDKWIKNFIKERQLYET